MTLLKDYIRIFSGIGGHEEGLPPQLHQGGKTAAGCGRLRAVPRRDEQAGPQGCPARRVRRGYAAVSYTHLAFVGRGAGRFQRDRCAAGDAGERCSGRGGIAMTYRAWNTKTVDRALSLIHI